MNENITAEEIEQFREYLVQEERSVATVEKYIRDVRVFILWLSGRKLDKNGVLAYKEKLVTSYTASSTNSMLAALNCFFRFLGRIDCTIKSVRVQRKIYCEKERKLTKDEYLQLVSTCKKKGNRRLSLIMQTICSTGIRVSELPFITVQAAGVGRTEVRCKGKQRIVFLPRQLCRQLLTYIKEEKLTEGPVFVTKSGRPVNRSNIWSSMKRLCLAAGVAPSKVFPHNLRHLFARTFYTQDKDLSRLADLLGHSNIDTTRIYMMSDGKEHLKKIEKLGLVS